MKELVCDMCGSNNIIKQNGLFVCQACNTKYSIEEARKMMAGETVEVEGTVKIDSSEDLENLYELARRAFKYNNYDNALKYYDQLIVKFPNDWESQFYVLYCKGKSCNNEEIVIILKSLSDSIGLIIKLIKDNAPQEEYEDIISEISLKTFDVCDDLYKRINSPEVKFSRKYKKKISYLVDMMYNLGDSLIETFDGEYSGYAVRSWIKGVELHYKYFVNMPIKFTKDKEKYVEKIQKYQPDYEPKSKRCYVATSVYGSYDCPEVWTLRRFRDNSLEKHIFGRLFIKTYYLTSPTLVKYCGDKKIFNSIVKPILDKFVKKLNEKGIKSTFYIDE